MLHYGEMVLAMYVGMLIFMPLEGLLPSSLQQIGMALFMAWPMVVWMRIRGRAASSADTGPEQEDCCGPVERVRRRDRRHAEGV